MKILSIIYGTIMFIRNKLYDLSILKSKKVDNIFVLCVGNIVAGGTGKTPVVQYYANKYINENKKVGILSRGYKGKREKDPYLVRDYSKIYGSFIESGDEAFLHALKLNVPVIEKKNRYKGVKYLKDNFDLDVVIMDDGFQHRKLIKDKSIILIDATNPFGGNDYIPNGRLRESINSLYRADEIIITKSNFIDGNNLKSTIKQLNKYDKSIHISKYIEKGFYNQKNERYSFDIIKDKDVLLISSIANPKLFRETISKMNVKKLEEIIFDDHHVYSLDELDKITNKSKKHDYIITTEKDIVKINKDINNLIVLEMGVEIEGV